jgi:hypothetical protein
MRQIAKQNLSTRNRFPGQGFVSMNIDTESGGAVVRVYENDADRQFGMNT